MKNHYKIGETANILGVSADTIRFYEKMGIVYSHKDEQNGYRYFTASDIYALMDVLFYRSMDIPVEEVREIMKAYQHEDVKNLLIEKEKQLKEKIQNQQKLLARIGATIRDYEILEESLGVFSYRDMPEMVVFNETPADSQVYFMRAAEPGNQNAAETVFSQNNQGFAAQKINGEWEMTRLYAVITKEQLGTDTPPEKSRVIPAVPALYTVVCTAWGGDFNQAVRPLENWAKSEGKTIGDTAYGTWVFTDYSQEPPLDYISLYLPVLPKK